MIGADNLSGDNLSDFNGRAALSIEFFGVIVRELSGKALLNR